MDDLYYCDWCSEGEKFERVDTIIYLDHCEIPNAVSIGHICQKCADAYDEFRKSRDDK